jgi:hypothetical protein
MLDGGNFLLWDGQIGPVILGGGAPLATGWWDPAVCHEPIVNINNLDVSPYQHLSHNSWPLCFLTPHLVPINTYLCSLIIFVRVLTTKVTKSCSCKSWFMLGLTMKTVMLGPDHLLLADGLPLSPWIDAKDSWVDSDLTTTYLSWLPSNNIP